MNQVLTLNVNWTHRTQYQYIWKHTKYVLQYPQLDSPQLCPQHNKNNWFKAITSCSTHDYPQCSIYKPVLHFCPLLHLQFLNLLVLWSHIIVKVLIVSLIRKYSVTISIILALSPLQQFCIRSGLLAQGQGGQYQGQEQAQHPENGNIIKYA